MKNKIVLFAALWVLLFNFSSHALAQDASKSNWNVNADLVSSYIWRGVNMSSPVSFQPSLSYSAGNFTLGTWSSAAFDGQFLEVDLFASYTLGKFTFVFTDYFVQKVDGVRIADYFQFDTDKTGHVFEAELDFSGGESFPLNAKIATAFYGADKNADGKQNYSTYLELAYAKTMKNIDFELFVGALFSDSQFYAAGAGLINAGISVSKTIKITDKFSLPISGAFITNPKLQDVVFVLKFSL